MLKLDRQFGLYVIREQLAVAEDKICCKAEDPFFDRDVVLKLVSPSTVGNRENLNRLNSYLQALSALENPAIAPLYDNGIEGDHCYFTTALYAGGSLADRLTQPMNIGKGMRIILQLSNGLAYAYSEGFEHGKLSLRDVFFTADDHAIIASFGILASITQLQKNPGNEGHLTPQGLRVETLQSLGEILIKLLLGPGAKPDAISAAVLKQSHSEPVFSLVTDLLGLSEREINSFDELIERLTDLAVLGSEVGINEYVEYVEQLRTCPSSIDLPGMQPTVTPSQRQLEIKEAVYAKGEIRRLVAEKTKLQEILSKAVSYKKKAELKLTSYAAALKAAKQAETKALNDLKLATFRTSGQRNQTFWQPVTWMVGGLIVGSLLTSGYINFQQPEQQEQFYAQKTDQTTAQLPVTTPMPVPEPSFRSTLPDSTTTTPVTKNVSPVSSSINSAVETSAPVPVAYLAVTDLQVPEATELKGTVSSTPTQEATELWWPAGAEFDEPAARAIASATKEPLPQPLTSPMTSSFSFPATATASSNLEGQVEGWWPAGSEFGATTAQQMAPVYSERDQEILQIVQDWAKAWSNQDQEEYFAHYSPEYRPEAGRTQEEWRAMRLSRLTRPQWINVILQDFKFRSVSENRVQVKLHQTYTSNHYEDRIKKSLNLVKEDGTWRILMERSLGSVNDMVGG